MTESDDAGSESSGQARPAARPEWARVKYLFDAVRDLDSGSRAALLDAACGADPSVRAEVESLLRWDGESSVDFLEQSPAAALLAEAGDPLIGQTLGAYRITARIGQGGMGTVYRAVRADAAYERAVAIKVMSRGLASERAIQQFRRERQALALLDHPNIARLVDGGTTSEGRPYLVMDYVEGVPLDVYCERHRLTIEQRLAIFQRVCEAVEYAHRRLLVHRDIKPENILVSRDGVPKLLDFGVAKLLDGTADVEPGFGVSHMMTPAYSSPEQISYAPITTASDVYSLGVVLYVLLSGQRPFDTGDSGRTEIQRLVCDTVAIRPSDAVRRAENRPVWAGRLSSEAASRRLDGDLDAIVMRAIAKLPGDRYGSVEQLADDVRRHVSREPVSSRPATLMYRCERFVARHRVGVVIAGAGIAAVVLGVSGVIWQARVASRERARAERRLNDVRHLADSFMFEVHDAIVNIPGTTAARALMVRKALEYLDVVAGESTDDPSLQRELASGYLRIADAQGHPMSANLGDTAGARVSYDKAIAICRALLRERPDDVDGRRTLAMALRKQGDVVSWSGDIETAVERATASRALWTALAAAPAAPVEDRLQGAVADIKMGDLLGNPNFPNAGRPADAVAAYDRALPPLLTLTATVPANERVSRYVALVYERLGTMAESADDLSAALSAYERSFGIRDGLAAQHPLHVEMQRDLAVADEKVGNVLARRGDLAGALDRYRVSLARFEALASDQSNALAARSVAISLLKVGAVLDRLHRTDEALTACRRAQRIHETLAHKDPASAQAQKDLAEATAAIAVIQRVALHD